MTRPENYKEAYAEEMELNEFLRDKIMKLQRDLKDCRNELCLKCGDYKKKHLGACDGCRWRSDNG